MDEIVRQAIARWPNVPHCYGWLGLDARGNWYLRDEAAQAMGSFADGPAQARGSRIHHRKLIEFIERNYECDEAGRWFFQNGPQRVYVELEATPWILRLDGDLRAQTHSGRSVAVSGCLVDESGRVYLQTEVGLGLVHTQDMVHAADAIEAGRWIAQSCSSSDLPRRFGYVQSPQRDARSR